MSQRYTEKRVAEALNQAKGNTARARALLIEWAQQDSRLLQGLTEKHLDGIVAYHVKRVLERAKGGKRSEEGRRANSPVKPRRAPKRSVQSRNTAFGMDVLKAVVENGDRVFGLESYAAPVRQGQVSQRHINAIHQIVKAGQDKRV